MPRQFRSLDDILSDPDAEQILETPKKPSVPSQHQRLVSGFQEIESFVADNSRLPTQSGDDSERRLARRLAAILKDPHRLAVLRDFDELGILASCEANEEATSDEAEDKAPSADHEQVRSLDDILALGDELLESPEPDIFNAEHVDFSDRDMPDEIAQRTRCDDFWRFEPLFDDVRRQLREGLAEKVRFQRESQIDEGDFFILDGVMCLVDEVGEDSGEGGRYNPRLRVIFDNGTESNLLHRSLSRALYKDKLGRRILLDRETVFDRSQGISHRAKRSGWIYVLRSKSSDPALAGRGDVLKIGYTEGEVAKRIAGAENDSTYLEAPVEVAATFECYDLDPHKFERLIHGFLAERRLNVTLTGRDGQRYSPQEWFEVPLKTAKAVIERVVDGSIVNYRLNPITGDLVEKNTGTR